MIAQSIPIVINLCDPESLDKIKRILDSDVYI